MRLAVLGAGAVGGAVAELADEYGHEVVALADSSTAAVDDDGVDAAAALQAKAADAGLGTAAPEDALAADYDVLVEATPTTLGDAQPGFDHVASALERDRDVVLANKGPVAERYADVRALAADSAGSVQFEATVAGAIPVLSTLSDLGPSRVDAVRGVLNGTANFVLSRMAAEGLGYEHVLAEAQDLGVAEADPAFDVEGTDAALKCVILSNRLAEAETESVAELRAATTSLAEAEIQGITDLPPNALELAADDGQTVRLIGEATRDSVRVGPRLVPENGTLAVSGTRNIVELETAHAGRLAISGRGAGGDATATAVLSDVNRL
ncbi:homoserine dehydrogenase [Halobaculum sp. MBLA0143]|uniref:homoserine dehydrogenase n=1 Tax=Halobaculum sp. MBLA0143 TaxID=3079933 RepID=UPI003523C599